VLTGLVANWKTKVAASRRIPVDEKAVLGKTEKLGGLQDEDAAAVHPEIRNGREAKVNVSQVQRAAGLLTQIFGRR
jgi:hypothetical protein